MVRPPASPGHDGAISLMFAGILVGTFRSLGHPESRSDFGFIRVVGDADA
jgi:hypothetical protein